MAKSPQKPAGQEFTPSPKIQEQRAYEQRVQASNQLARQAKQLKQRVGYLTQQVRAKQKFYCMWHILIDILGNFVQVLIDF